LRSSYAEDPLFSKVIREPSNYRSFLVWDGFVYSTNRRGDEVLCIPRVKYKGRTTTQLILDQAHETVGHYGPQRTSEYVRRWFWW
ncbi:hypothetical protein K466DRAFT_441548, partial [Polyporus arcularius HHB13444]